MANNFGLARPKIEGAPMHPDDILWEHHKDECKKCYNKYMKQLEAYNKWAEKYYGK